MVIHQCKGSTVQMYRVNLVILQQFLFSSLIIIFLSSSKINGIGHISEGMKVSTFFM